MLAKALLLEAQGRPGEALLLLTKAWELCSTAGVVAEFPVIGPDLVRLALAGGEPFFAQEVTLGVESVAKAARIASVTGAALRCRGLVEGDPDILLQAAVTYRRSPRWRERALTCEDTAVALAATGRRAEARLLAEESLEIYRSLDASRDILRAEARLRRTGLRCGSVSRRGAQRARSMTGWESLTQAERGVASLLVEGLSNVEIARRLFISPRTVQAHVSHALEKLDLASRVELALEAAKWVQRLAGSEPSRTRSGRLRLVEGQRP
jgi:DNA-binding CsgD family transcriptional regulator